MVIVAMAEYSGVRVGYYVEFNNIVDAISCHRENIKYHLALAEEHRQRLKVLEGADPAVFKNVAEYDKYLESLKLVEEINKRILDKKENSTN